MVCPPCAKVCGYEQEDLMSGVALADLNSMLELVQNGASTLNF